jgi:hypothetical protein
MVKLFFFFVIFCLGLFYLKLCPSNNDLHIKVKHNFYLNVSDYRDCKKTIEIKKKIEEKYGMLIFFFIILIFLFVEAFLLKSSFYFQEKSF